MDRKYLPATVVELYFSNGLLVNCGAVLQSRDAMRKHYPSGYRSNDSPGSTAVSACTDGFISKLYPG
jgi:hypothetical protein